MKDLMRSRIYRAGTVVMLLALVAWMAFPAVALASKQIVIDIGGGEGDPIDGNDFSSGGSGGSDDYFHQDFSTWSGGLLVLPMAFDGVQIMIVPQFDAGVFNVHFLVVRDVADSVEASHAE